MTAFTYDARGNRVSATTREGASFWSHVTDKTTFTYDGRDDLVAATVTGSNGCSDRDSGKTVFVRDGMGRALTVVEDGHATSRLYDGLEVVAEGDTQLVRDPAGAVQSEVTTTRSGHHWWDRAVTTSQDVLGDVLGSPIGVAVDGVISKDVQVFGDFGDVIETAAWDTVTGFTGQVSTGGLVEFATRTYDTATRVWLQDDSFRGTTTRSASLNRYAYVEGAPESFVDVLGFYRARAAVRAQALAAAQAAYDAARKAYNAIMSSNTHMQDRLFAREMGQIQAQAAQRAASAQWAEAQRVYEKTVKLANLRMANDKAQAQIESDRGKLWLYNAVNAFKESAPDMVTMARNEAIGVGKFVVGLTPIPNTVKSVQCIAGGWSAMNACAQNARNEQKALLDTAKKVLTQVAVRDQLMVDVFKGDASIGEWWDAAYQIPRDLTFGSLLDACKAGQYDKCGQGIGETEAAVFVLLLPGVEGAAAPAVAIDAVRAAELATAEAEAATNALATATNEAVFWSGIRGGDQAAASWAATNQGVTLEATMAQRGITLPTWDASNPTVVAAWRQASAEFAAGAEGDVTVLQQSVVRTKSVWAEVEFPALKANPDVTSITAVDPATGLRTVLWTRP